MTDTNHTDSVEAKNTAIHLTTTLDTEVFKGRYSSSTLETIEAIIKRELTTLQAQTSQQVEEAVRKERADISAKLQNILTSRPDSETAGYTVSAVSKMVDDLKTPNHQD